MLFFKNNKIFNIKNYLANNFFGLFSMILDNWYHFVVFNDDHSIKTIPAAEFEDSRLLDVYGLNWEFFWRDPQSPLVMETPLLIINAV